MQNNSFLANKSWATQQSLYNEGSRVHFEDRRKNDFSHMGIEGEKLKNYVQETLNGDQTRKNYQILANFQKQAEKRRHNYLHRERKSYNDDPALAKRQRYHTIESGNTDQIVLKKRDRLSLLPADKKIPPIYQYYQRAPVQRVNNGRPQDHYYQRSVNSIPNVREPRGFTINNSEQEFVNQRSWALRKIKSKAQQKRNDSKVQIKDSDQTLISALQEQKYKKRDEYEQMSRRIKRLKKYKFYIKALQPRHLQ